MTLITSFDPWNGAFCTCIKKFSLSPYTGCGHRCIYCYITSYIPRAFEPRIKNNFIYNLRKEITKINKRLVVSIANSSDPYQQLENNYKFTRATLTLLKDKFDILILTKSTLILRDIDILRKCNVIVALTITTDNENIARIIEPEVASPNERIKCAEKLVKKGIRCYVRLDPIIPYINEDIELLIKKLANINIKHITVSTYKAREDSLKRLQLACNILGIKDNFNELYIERYGRVRYLKKSHRYEIIKKLKATIESHGLTFASCRENLQMKFSGSCDGSTLLYDYEANR